MAFDIIIKALAEQDIAQAIEWHLKQAEHLKTVAKRIKANFIDL